MNTRILTAALAATCLFAGSAFAEKPQGGKTDRPDKKERKDDAGKPVPNKGEGRKPGPKMDKEKKTEAKSGTFVGTLAAKDGGRIVVESPRGRMEFIPYWRGGAPDQGGGFDKEMMKQLEGFKTGDRVQVKWVFEEHNRIDQIKKLDGKGLDKPDRPPRGDGMRKQRGEGRDAPALTEEQGAERRARREAMRKQRAEGRDTPALTDEQKTERRAKHEEMRKQRGEGRDAPALTEEQRAERRARREEMRKRHADADSKE